MKRKSEKGPTHISATEASRSFSEILDQIEEGATYIVHRRGRSICSMTRPPVHGRKASECLDLLRGRTPVRLDDEFSTDLMAILEGEPVEDRHLWES
ncbi:MAG: hypothetical protein AMXMBFR33_38220 [Candidatus Xenobia bacterium]